MYSYNDRISYSQVDSNLNTTFFALVNLLQDCSCFHSDDVGVGLKFLTPQKLGWFVTSYEIHVNRMPCYLEQVKISTYPYAMRGMMAKRIYVVETLDGEVLAYANSQWILMNIENGKPERMPKAMLDAYQDGVEMPSFEFLGDRLKVAGEHETVGEFVVSENYIDTNGHMNNSFYIDVTRRFIPDKEYKTVTINYRKAALLNDCLQVKLVAIENGYQVALVKDGEIYTLVEYK